MGMLRADPTSRFTMDKIQSHSWLQGEMATQNEVCDFYMGLKEAEDQACEENSNGNRDN